MASRFLYKILWNTPRSFSQFYTKRCRQAGFVIDCHLLGTGSFIHKYDFFALKGGTAINFFMRDLPRLSVDIDLTYLPVEERNISLQRITNTMNSLSEDIVKRFFGASVVKKKLEGTDNIRGLVVRFNDLTIKIEPNLVMRGAVFDPVVMSTDPFIENEFEQVVDMRVLSLEDVYAGKICAALDRQHPRDLFDIKLLFENEGFTDRIKQAFIVYLLAHPRPMVEVLNPNFLDISGFFVKEFSGMSRLDVSFEELIETRKTLVKTIRSALSDKDKEFLLSVKSGKPNWSLCDTPYAEDFPAVKWKLFNIQKMHPDKHCSAIKKLSKYFVNNF